MAKTTTPPAAFEMRQDSASISPDMPTRPVLADRQCTQQADAGKGNTSHPPKSQAQGKLPRVGTISNGRMPRTSSANGLPRGRSFHGVRPLSAAVRAGHDGYNQHKAAKMYAEKRRAAATTKAERDAREGNRGDRKDVGASDLINITVDSKGVMIDNPSGTSQGIQSLGGRKNSRSRMTRSTSRSRNSFHRADDKENAISDLADFRSLDHDFDPYFSRKRSVDLIRRKREGFTDHGSWDGSMPRRHSSRSFIEHNSRPANTGKTEGEKPNGLDSSTQPRSNRTENNVGERSRRHHSEKNPRHKNDSATESNLEALGAKQTLKEDEADLAKTMPRGADLEGTPVKGANSDVGEQTKNSASPVISDISESGTDGDSKTSSPDKDKKIASLGQGDPKQNASMESLGSSTHTENCSGNSNPKALSDGKWCDDCAGLGLHIAALLSELDKRHPRTESGSEGLSSSGGSKKGWKSMVTQTVLGDSKSKSSSEKALLQQEISILRATVEFLFKKVEKKKSGVSKTGPSDT